MSGEFGCFDTAGLEKKAFHKMAEKG